MFEVLSLVEDAIGIVKYSLSNIWTSAAIDLNSVLEFIASHSVYIGVCTVMCMMCNCVVMCRYLDITKCNELNRSGGAMPPHHKKWGSMPPYHKKWRDNCPHATPLIPMPQRMG